MNCLVNFFTGNKGKINRINFLQKKTHDIESLVDERLKKWGCLDFKKLPAIERTSISREIQELYRSAHHLTKDKSFFETTLLKKLLSKALSLKLGGKVNYQHLASSRFADFNHFILRNHLHHKAHALCLQFEQDEDGPFIPVYLEGKTVQAPWSALTIIPKRKGSGFSYYYLRALIFETDQNFILSREFSLTSKGIQRHNYLSSDPVIPIDFQDPREWGCQNVLEVKVALKDKSGRAPTLGKGDHAFIVLKSSEGAIYSLGKLRHSEVFSWKTFFLPLAPKKGGIACPDIFSYLPYDDRFLYKKSFVITSQQFEAILQIASYYRDYSSLPFSLLKDNCVTFIQKVLKHVLKIDVDPEMFLPTYLLKGFLPKKLLMWIPSPRKRILPLWFKRIFCFFPPLYAFTVFAGFAIKSLSLSKSSDAPDFSWEDIFLRPWKVSLHHPLALMHSLKSLKGVDKSS